ncbi:MAG: hydrogenase maturation protease [Planctomycetota bacterium]
MSGLRGRIICVGNRLVDEDAAGPAVHDHLRARAMPDGVELIDGGLLGLDLLRFMTGAGKVVFVDAVTGFLETDGVVVLSAGEAGARALGTYGHDGGLAYLLNVLPRVMEGDMPEVRLVGVQGAVSANLVSRAADISLDLAAHGWPLEAAGRTDLARLD